MYLIWAIFSVSVVSLPVVANALPLQVSTTYYGGHYDQNTKNWVIDNQNQCQRIAAGEFSAKSLGAIIADGCDDDNGLTSENDVPLHNTVSFAELSKDPAKRDYSALGNLPSKTRLEIAYNGRCLVAEKRDVGTGGYGIEGKPRALDLWWQTARSIGFTSGLDVMDVRTVTQNTPLTPLGQSYACGSIQDQTLTTGREKKNTQTTEPSPAKAKASLEDQSGPHVLGYALDADYISLPSHSMRALLLVLSVLFGCAAAGILFYLNARSSKRRYRLQR